MRYNTQKNPRRRTPSLSDADRDMLDAIRAMLGLRPCYVKRPPPPKVWWDAWPELDEVVKVARMGVQKCT